MRPNDLSSFAYVFTQLHTFPGPMAAFLHAVSKLCNITKACRCPADPTPLSSNSVQSMLSVLRTILRLWGSLKALSTLFLEGHLTQLPLFSFFYRFLFKLWMTDFTNSPHME